MWSFLWIYFGVTMELHNLTDPALGLSAVPVRPAPYPFGIETLMRAILGCGLSTISDSLPCSIFKLDMTLLCLHLKGVCSFKYLLSNPCTLTYLLFQFLHADVSFQLSHLPEATSTRRTIMCLLYMGGLIIRPQCNQVSPTLPPILGHIIRCLAF